MRTLIWSSPWPAMGEQAALWLLVAVMSLACFTCVQYDQYSGPYDMTVERMAECDDLGTEEISISNSKMTKVSRYSYDYYTNYTLKIPVDDSVSLVVDMQPWGNGGWRTGFLTMDFPQICNYGREIIPTWFKEILRNTGREDCPIPEGTYQLTMRNVSFMNYGLPTLPYGKYRITNEAYKGDQLIGCTAIVVDVAPKRNIRRKKKNST